MEVLLRTCLLLAIFGKGWSDTSGSLVDPSRKIQPIPTADNKDIIASVDKTDTQNIIPSLSKTDIQGITSRMNSTNMLDNLRTVNWNDILSDIVDVMKTKADVSQHCRLDILRFGLDLIQGKNYTLQMLDACGKPPSGLLTGSFNWLGRYSECSKLKGADHNITFDGKYFLATFKLKALTLNIGLCLPSSCSDADVTKALTNSTLLQALMGQRTLQVTAKAREAKPIDGGTVAAMCICGVLGLFLLLGTMYDVMIHRRRTEGQGYQTLRLWESTNQDQKAKGDTGTVLPNSTPEEDGVVGRILLPFSVYTNTLKLLSTEQPPDSIRCLHGIRFLSMSWVILGHTYYYGLAAADNVLTLLGMASRFTFEVILNGTLAVDSFFFLSGLLLSYHLLKQINKYHQNGRAVPFAMIYVQRYLRLTPAYAFVLMLFVWVYPQLFSGPFVAGRNVDLCKQYWWTNVLYINNLVTPGTTEDKCIASAWYLANDMQMFVIGVPVVYLMYRWWYVGVAALLSLLLASLVTSAVLATDQDLTGRATDGDIKAAGTIYDKPYTRIGPYLVGMAAGWLLLKTKGKVLARTKTTQMLAFTGWCFATASALAVVYALYGTYHGVVMTIQERALYISVRSTVWALCLGWVVLACYHGYGGVVNSILSWSAWVPLARLTYCNYLLHSFVIMVYYRTRDVPAYFSDLDVIYYFLGNVTLSFGLAFLLCVAVEAPLMRLVKAAFDTRTNQTTHPSIQDVQQDSEQDRKAVATPGLHVC